MQVTEWASTRFTSFPQALPTNSRFLELRCVAQITTRAAAVHSLRPDTPSLVCLTLRTLVEPLRFRFIHLPLDPTQLESLLPAHSSAPLSTFRAPYSNSISNALHELPSPNAPGTSCTTVKPSVCLVLLYAYIVRLVGCNPRSVGCSPTTWTYCP